MCPEVFVYILNHNYANYLEQCLKSVLNQTYKNIRLCIFDDGSSDASPELIKNLSKRYGVDFILNPKIGFMQNVRMATSNVKSKYFMRVDADDYCEPTLVEELVELLEKENAAGLAFANYSEVDANGHKMRQRKRFDFKDGVTVYDLPAHGACTLIRTSSFDSVGGYSKEIEKQDGHDLWLSMYGRFEVANSQKTLFNYRQHNLNLTKDNRSLLKARSKILEAHAKAKLPKVSCVVPFRNGEYKQISGQKFELPGGVYSFGKALEKLASSDFIERIFVISGECCPEEQHKKVVNVARPRRLEGPNVPVQHTIEWLDQSDLDIAGTIVFNPSYIFFPEEFVNGFIASCVFFDYDESFSYFKNSSLLYRHSGSGLEPMFNSEIRRENDDIYERKGLFTYFKKLATSNGEEKRIGHFEIDLLSSLSSKEMSILLG